MSSYIIAGTGTDVGKTFTTCALLHAARQLNFPVKAFKPIISGWVQTDDTDTAQLLTANGHQQTLEEISHWRLKAPLSPHIAAKKENVYISLEALVDWTKTQCGGEGLNLIEAVGGVAVPINDEHTTLDWMKSLHLPVILVAGSYLGSISHTLTAIMALQQAGLTIKAVVVNESTCSSVTFEDAEEGLSPFISGIELRIFQPRVSSYAQAQAIHALIGKL